MTTTDTIRSPGVFALACLLLATAAPASAGPVLTPYSAEYRVKISVLSGRLTTELRTTEHGYEAVHAIEPRGLADLLTSGEIIEQSRFAAQDDAIRASWYRSKDTLSSDETHAEVSFDWSAGELSGTVNGDPVRTSLDGLVHDRVAIQYQLMYDLLNGGADEHYVLFDIDEFKNLVVRNIGERQVSTPAGDFTAIGIQHQAENSSRVTTLWCVQALGYVPVVIEQHRKGKLRLRAELSHYEALST